MRGEFNFVFDIEIVFVVRRRRTGGYAAGLGSCEELAVAMVWQSSGRGPVPGPGTAQLPLPSHCQCLPGPSVSQRGHSGDTGDSEDTNIICPMVTHTHGADIQTLHVII